jgi:septum formation protein
MSLQAREPPLVLASTSKSRRALLAAAGLCFSTCPSGVDENSVKEGARAIGISPAATALELARLKAEAVARQLPEAIVIGCDQMLICGGEWFDKPTSLEVLRQQLQVLQGREHELVTATVCLTPGRSIWKHVEVPRLRMRPFSQEFLDSYIALDGEAAMTCVGGYRLEGPGIHLFEAITGEHSAILGLPLLPLLRVLREMNFLAS